MKRLERYFPLFAVAAVSVFGFGILLLSMRWGIGLSPDSAIYIGVARSLLRGFGLSVPSWSGEGAPLVYYPPLFSLLLAGISLFGMDPLAGARWLHATLFGANIFLIGLCLYQATRSFYLSGLASLLMLISFPVVLIHSMAWSEPLFIFFGFLGIFFLARYVERPYVWTLAASSVAIGLAFLTRYAGLSFVATGVGGALLLAREGRRERLFHAATFGLVSCAPMAAWMAGNSVLAGTTTGRTIAYHPLKREHLESFIETVATWLFPARVPIFSRWLVLLLVLFLGSLCLLGPKRVERRDGNSASGPTTLFLLAGLFLLSYLALIVLSVSFLDAQTPFDNRILSPVYVATVLSAFSLVAASRRHGSTTSPRLLPVVPGLILAIVSGSQVVQSASWLERSYHQGIGYASRQWSQAELLQYIKTLGPEALIFTNGPDIIYLLTGRPARMLPSKIDPGTTSPNSNYAREMAALRSALQDQGGLLVYFHGVSWRWYLPAEGELQEKLPLQAIVRDKEGRVYRIRNAGRADSAR